MPNVIFGLDLPDDGLPPDFPGIYGLNPVSWMDAVIIPAALWRRTNRTLVDKGILPAGRGSDETAILSLAGVFSSLLRRFPDA